MRDIMRRCRKAILQSELIRRRLAFLLMIPALMVMVCLYGQISTEAATGTASSSNWTTNANDGQTGDAVREITYSVDDDAIIGYAVIPDAASYTLVSSGDDYTVTVTYGDDAQLPDDVELIATEYEKDSETYLARCAEARALYGLSETDAIDFRLFDIGLYVGDEEIEPSAEVQVTISYSNKTDEAEYIVTHYAEEGTETPEARTVCEEGTQDISFTVNGFSDVSTLIALTSSSEEIRKGFKDDYNTWTIIDSSTNPVSSLKNALTFSGSVTSESGGKLTIENHNAIQLFLYEVGQSTLESALADDGDYTVSDLGTIRFSNAGTVSGKSVDILLTFDSVRFWGSYKDGHSSYYPSDGKVTLKDGKIIIGRVTAAGTLWMGQNYLTDTEVAARSRYNNTYGYPCAEDIDVTVKIVETGTDNLVDAPFLQVASDIDIYRRDERRGYWEETFKTCEGFNGTFYRYADNYDNIVGTGTGVVTAKATQDILDDYDGNLQGNDSYTKGSIYAETEGGEWEIGYTEGWCSTKLEIYNTDVTVNVKKVDADDPTSTLSGAEFYLYKIVNGSTLYYRKESDGSVSWVTDLNEATTVITGSNGIAGFDYLTPGSYGLVESSAPSGYHKISDTIAFKITTYGIVQLTQEYSYVTLDTGGSLTLTVVNEKTPSVDKEVESSDGSWIKYNTAGVGNLVSFQTTIDNLSSGTTNLVLHDTLSTGLADPAVTAVCLITDSGSQTLGSTDYTVAYASSANPVSDGCSFEITFSDTVFSELSGNAEIVVTYQATVTEDAVIGETGYPTEEAPTPTGGNPNETYITYGTDGRSETSTTRTYVYKMKVLKYDDTTEGSLSGAGFILYDASTPAKYAIVTGSKVTGWTDQEDEATEVETNSEGLITIEGLGAGTYYLQETVAPDGYLLPEEPVEITISESGVVSYLTTEEDGSGGTTEVTVTTDDYTVGVGNTLGGSELPMTGGNGTRLFTIAGLLLMGSTACVLNKTSRRRKEREG